MPKLSHRSNGFTVTDGTLVLRLEPEANERQLTAEERAEYQEFVESIDFVAILKAQARRTLARQAL
ncbi:MAG TPA: hypothetical protein VML55_24950 [Planctomycetaceae bacterium]|nr:hypothetical protein [Planctomycetaceae bacterium]